MTTPFELFRGDGQQRPLTLPQPVYLGLLKPELYLVEDRKSTRLNSSHRT